MEWIASDFHFGHKNIIKYQYRPEGFEDLIFENLKVIQPEDTLFFLGDFCMGRDLYWHDKFFKQFKFKCELIKGNHDNRSDSFYKRNGWNSVSNGLGIQYCDKWIFMVHNPDNMVIEDDEIVIHGHLHSRIDLVKNPDKQILYAPELFDYKPVPLHDLINNHLKNVEQGKN